MSDEQSFHLTIGSRFENIELVQLILKGSLDRLGLDEDNRHWIDVAVREAVANAIKHGNREDPAKQVVVDLTLEDDTVVIRVEDEGIGFDPAHLEDPLAPGEPAQAERARDLLHERASWTTSSTARGPGGGTLVTLAQAAGQART
jgi:serine/threonine-protein kinase RsbW